MTLLLSLPTEAKIYCVGEALDDSKGSVEEDKEVLY